MKLALSVFPFPLRLAPALLPFLLIAGTLRAQGPASKEPEVSTQTAPSSQAAKPHAAVAAKHHSRSAAPSSASSKFIVHGRWHIVVRNPDGTVATDRNFENSLLIEGERLLMYLLSGQGVPGGLSVALDSNFTVSPCPAIGINTGCYLYNSGEQNFSRCNGGANCFPTLAVSVAANSDSTLTLNLNGQMLASQDGQIDDVSTAVIVCKLQSDGNLPDSAITSISPSTCFSTLRGGDLQALSDLFTETQITPIKVLSGQTVQVTVAISFATGNYQVFNF